MLKERTNTKAVEMENKVAGNTGNELTKEQLENVNGGCGLALLVGGWVVVNVGVYTTAYALARNFNRK